MHVMLWRETWHLRGQVIAVAMVVMCGVASFIAMRTTYNSLIASRDAYYATFRFADVFASLKRAPANLADDIAQLPGTSAVTTRIVKEVLLDLPGLRAPATARLISLPAPGRDVLNGLFLRQGRWPDIGRDLEVVASEAFAHANGLHIGDSLGANLNGRWQLLRIVGIGLSPEYVYEVGSGSIFPDNKHFGVLWLRREALGAAFNIQAAFNDVALALTHAAKSSEVLQALDRLLAPYGGLTAYTRDDQVSNHFLTDEISQNRVTSTIIPAIFLGVAAFIMHIALSRLVALRRTEIGLLKAFGYSDWAVGVHYLQLALIIVAGGVLTGTMLGAYLGRQLTAMYSEFYHFPQLIHRNEPDVLLTGAVLSLMAALLGAQSSVRAAVALPPAEAMRPASPTSFHAGRLNLYGSRRLVPVTVRMLLRNLLRQTWKSFLTVLGLAVAVGILVISRFFFDAVTYLMSVQFDEIMRFDAQVQFREPLPDSARFALLHLPGVLRVEPQRAVAVRLQHSHRWRRLEVLGLDPNRQLRRLLDANLHVVPLPSEGILISSKLADVLNARVGDKLSINVLEEKRSQHTTVVAAIVDDPVGLNAYMSIDAVNRLLGHAITLTGADLAVDALFADDLYAALKRSPAVSGVIVKSAAIQSFTDILERSVMVSSVINIVFACIIAFGVVYNSARIALSERGNELASLRVLGFNEREIAALLLGEQALLTFVAIPIGWVLGYWTCAYLSARLSAEFYRIPLVVQPSTYALAFVVVTIAACGSGWLVARRLRDLDLIAVLKTRE